MNLPYFYEKIIESNHVLSEATGKHCIQVLRMKAGEQLQLTDGKGNLYTAGIIHADKKNCTINIDEHFFTEPSKIKISISISLLKNPTRFEWFLEKATEIGVAEIIPLICTHTEKENFRYERMHNILVSAMLQSRQTWLPQLNQPTKFEDFIDVPFDGIKMIAHCADEQKQSLQTLMQQPQNKLMLIGPEGDFSDEEISKALEKNFIAITLGNTRLRSETAGVVAAALLCSNVKQDE